MNANEEIPVEENAKSFLSTGDDNVDGTRTPFRFLRRRATACNKNEQKGNSLRFRKIIMLCTLYYLNLLY